MENKVSVRLITVNQVYNSKWVISVNSDNPFSIIVTRYPKETQANLLKEIYSLPDLEQSTILANLDLKNRLYHY